MDYQTDLDAPLIVLEKDFVPGLGLLHDNGDVTLVIGISRIKPPPDRGKNVRIYHADVILFSRRLNSTIFTYADFVFGDPQYVMGFSIKKILFCR